VNTHYGLTTQLVWVKIAGEQGSASDFLLVLDEENFRKLINQANELLNQQ
jgi:hypothetical protein